MILEINKIYYSYHERYNNITSEMHFFMTNVLIVIYGILLYFNLNDNNNHKEIFQLISIEYYIIGVGFICGAYFDIINCLLEQNRITIELYNLRKSYIIKINKLLLFLSAINGIIMFHSISINPIHNVLLTIFILYHFAVGILFLSHSIFKSINIFFAFQTGYEFL